AAGVRGDRGRVGRVDRRRCGVGLAGLAQPVGAASDQGAAGRGRGQQRRDLVEVRDGQETRVIGIVTDSNSQLPPELVDRYAVEVVPLVITVDGKEHAEGVDIDADEFYALFDNGATPSLATSQPTPARFAEAYMRVAARGATEILSIHIASALSGTSISSR